MGLRAGLTWVCAGLQVKLPPRRSPPRARCPRVEASVQTGPLGGESGGHRTAGALSLGMDVWRAKGLGEGTESGSLQWTATKGWTKTRNKTNVTPNVAKEPRRPRRVTRTVPSKVGSVRGGLPSTDWTGLNLHSQLNSQERRPHHSRSRHFPLRRKKGITEQAKTSP